ncbi:MAG: ABC transporter ATP-binding protein [bacterium]|nr:ABC transporter ATP-binding protein [bacterium]
MGNIKKKVLEFKFLTAGYKNKQIVLKDINLAFGVGDFVAVVGPNGSGKTTFIRAIFGLAKILSGEIIVNKADCGVVAQMSKPVFNFLVKDFIEFGCHFSSGADYKEVIQGLDLEHLLHQGIQEISAGEYQRTLIAQTLFKNPKILLLDEPLSHLDLKYQIKLVKFLKNLNGITIIAIIHHLDFALKYFDELIFMKNGEIKERVEHNDFHFKTKINSIIEEVFEVKFYSQR